MSKFVIVLAAMLSVSGAWAGYSVERTEVLSVGKLEGQGQISNPARSPDGKEIYFELLTADGESTEVYTALFENPSVFPPALTEAKPVVPANIKDVFSLGSAEERSITEGPSWGSSTKRGNRIVVAATRREAGRGGQQVNFDLYFSARGKRRYLTEHPDNDSAPAFSPDGEFISFASGRSGEGDIYIYSFFAQESPLQRITFEESGSELYPTWNRDSKQLAFIGHLGGADHLLVIDDVKSILAKTDINERKAAVRSTTRDLTAGWPHSALTPSFSPDGKWIAFFMHPKGLLRTDLYVVKTEGGEPILLKENVLSFSRTGPCWSPRGEGVFVVEESAKLMNPIVFVGLDPTSTHIRLDTHTQLNTDITAWSTESATYLMYAAQGGGEDDKEKRWRKIFISRLNSM